MMFLRNTVTSDLNCIEKNKEGKLDLKKMRKEKQCEKMKMKVYINYCKPTT